MTENELAGMHHHLDGHEFEQALKIGQRSLVCCSPWSRKELDTTEQLNLTDKYPIIIKPEYQHYYILEILFLK